MWHTVLDALREPAAQLVQLAVSALALALASVVRGKQRTAHEQLRDAGVLPPKD
jgi:hypothetical protein